MVKNKTRIFSAAAALLFSSVAAYSQTATTGTYGSFSPYSIYGVGEISRGGTAQTRSMGGVGVATRNRRFINISNPAAVTARDTLAFMADFGLYEDNKIYSQSGKRGAENTFNINNIAVSFPIWRSSAFLVGISPFSDVGYSFSSNETDETKIAQTGNITYDSYGDGSLYQMYVSAGATFWKRLSLGAEFIYYFGTLDRNSNETFSSSTYRSISYGTRLNLNGFTGKFGVQYEQKLSPDVSMTLGATYRLGTKLRGYENHFAYASQSSVVDTIKTMTYTDTLSKVSNAPRVADELGVGVAFKGGDRWSVEFNYLRSDWRNSNFDSRKGFSANGQATFSSTVSQSFRAGFEFVPNRNDIRYYMKRVSYRGGLYYDQDYFLMNGNRIDSYGLTLGVTLPVFRWYNGISLGVDIGRRGSSQGMLVSETYFKFVVGFNIHDIWFQKPKYN